jgi:hypothetical protein
MSQVAGGKCVVLAERLDDLHARGIAERIQELGHPPLLAGCQQLRFRGSDRLWVQRVFGHTILQYKPPAN